MPISSRHAAVENRPNNFYRTLIAVQCYISVCIYVCMYEYVFACVCLRVYVISLVILYQGFDRVSSNRLLPRNAIQHRSDVEQPSIIYI